MIIRFEFFIIQNLKFSIHLPLFLLTRSPDDSPVILSRDPMKLPIFPNREYQLFGINFIFSFHFFIFWALNGIAPSVWGGPLKNFWGVSLFSHFFTRADFNPVKCPILFLSSNFYKCSTGVWDNIGITCAFSLSSCVCVGVYEKVSASHYEYIF